MAEFTGIEDGREEKTINLALEEDKKNGYFGNATAGGGAMERPEGGYDPDRFTGRFNLNRFSNNTQLSAIGLANNINEQGFSINDYIQFMGGLSNLMGGGGNGGGSRKISLSFDPGNAGMPLAGFDTGNGFTTTWAGGLNLNHDFSKKTRLNASYFYNRIGNDINRTVTRENLLGDQNFASEEQEDRFSRNANHRINTTLRHELDSFQNIILRSGISFNDAVYNSIGSSLAFNPEGTPENESLRDYRSTGNNFSLDTDLTYRRRFRRRGRAFVAGLAYRMGENNRDGNLFSLNQFYQTNAMDTVNQRQSFNDNAKTYSATWSYTEPVGKGQYVELRASRQNYANETSKDFYDRTNGSELFNQALSNRFRRGYRYDQAGLNFLLNRKKYNLSTGLTLQNSTLEGKLLNEGKTIDRSFLRLLPAMFFDYEFATSRNMNLSYTTQLQEPSLEQLQPAVDNSDPLNTYTGNPNLKPEYVHNLNGHFMLFDQFSFTSFFANFDAYYTKDRITNASTIDSLFRRNTQPINVDRDIVLRGGLSFGTPLRFIKMNVRMGVNSSWNRGILYVNEVENNMTNWRNSFKLSFDNRKKDFVDLTIGGKLSYNRTDYSISESLNQNFVERNLFADLVVTPTEKWEISSGFDYTVYSGETFGGQEAVPIWKGELRRYILKNNRGQIRLTAFDLLNRNIGINRSSLLNYVQEERVRSLGRYVMLSFAYSISGFNKEHGGIEIRMERD